MAQQAAFVGRPEGGRWPELQRSPRIVEQGGGEEEITSQPRVELCRLAAERRHADRVLEQAAGVVVVLAGSRGKRAQAAPEPRVGEKAADDVAQAGVGELAGEELQEPLELVPVAPRGRREVGRIRFRRRFERAHLELEAVAETLDPPEHANGVAFAEARVEQLDVAPDARVDPAARVDELEREVGRPGASPQPFLPGDRVDALDDAVLGELRDRAHVPWPDRRSASIGAASLGRGPDARLARVAELRPFRAVRYEVAAGPLDSLVAPPYDVISPGQREELAAKSPYNVMRLTLPRNEDEAAELWRRWQEEGVLVREREPAVWWLSQDYVGPDGVRRSRDGLVASLRLEPYSAGVVLPHERTHRGPKEERLRLLRATRVELEPIFLLYEGSLAAPRRGASDLEVELDGVRNRLWRLESGPPSELSEAQLLIADGHHRYETALAFHGEVGSEASAWMMVVVVPTEQEGLTIFPTHRIAERLSADLPASRDGDVRSALERIEGESRERAAAVLYRGGEPAIVHGEEGELDSELVERFRPEGVSYTPRVEEAVAAVDGGHAEAAFLLRPPTVEQVAAVARSGGTMPQKSTYFYPKLLSGLLFHPL